MLNQPKGITALTLTLLGYAVGMGAALHRVRRRRSFRRWSWRSAPRRASAFYEITAFLLGRSTRRLPYGARVALLTAALQRGAHADPLPAPAAGRRRARDRGGWCGSRWRRPRPGCASLALLVVLMFVALTTRLWFLQVLEGPRFRDSAREQQRPVRVHRSRSGADLRTATGGRSCRTSRACRSGSPATSSGPTPSAWSSSGASSSTSRCADLVARDQHEAVLHVSRRCRSPSSSTRRSSSTSASIPSCSPASRSWRPACGPTRSGRWRRTRSGTSG